LSEQRLARGLIFERGSIEFGRIIAFFDGVVAIALTLLILGIDLPQPQGSTVDANVFELVGQLGDQIFAFVLSFVIIAFYWIGNHRFVSQLKHIDYPMLVWSFAFLLAIVFMPFEAQIIGYYGDSAEAITLYAGWFVLFGVIEIVGYLLAKQRNVLAEAPSAAMVRFQIAARAAAPAVFLVSIPVAYLVAPNAASWTWFLIWPVSSLATRNPPKA
jgi:uncharacterized membrane protein